MFQNFYYEYKIIKRIQNSDPSEKKQQQNKKKNKKQTIQKIQNLYKNHIKTIKNLLTIIGGGYSTFAERNISTRWTIWTDK